MKCMHDEIRQEVSEIVQRDNIIDNQTDIMGAR